MSAPRPGAGRVRHARSPHARRARFWLATGTALLALIIVALILLRPVQAPYTPGTEATTGDEITSRLSRSIPDEAPAIRFVDAADDAGIRFTHFSGTRSTQLPEDMGSGAAWGDYDGDDDPDLYLVNEAGPLTSDERAETATHSVLYRNEGGGRFIDVTDKAGVGAGGWGLGAAWGDFDGDRDLDLVVTRYGTNILYRNDGGGRFTDVSSQTRVGAEKGFFTGASWADYDRDGDLDLYVCGYVKYTFDAQGSRKKSFQYGALIPYTLNPSSYAPERNLLYRNDGGIFTEVAKQAGVDNLSGRSLSASWCDFDGDGWPDIYVANDISDNAMFRNMGDGNFEDVSHQAWVADHRGAMGLGIGDWENDGDFDIFITHWIAQENALYENLKDRMPVTKKEPMHFIDQADMLGLGQIALDYIGWGTGFFDYDNDGRLDLYAVNGSTFQKDDDPSRLVPMKNLLFWNAGKEKGYFEVGAIAGESFTRETVGRGAAAADYDGDGDLDLAIMANGGPARLLRNEADNGNHWIRLRLEGAAKPSSSKGGRARFETTTFATGAVVRVVTGEHSQMRQIGGGSSYLSQEPPGEAHFGLGAAAQVDRLSILWPDGITQSFEALPANTTIRIVQGGQPQFESKSQEPAATSVQATPLSPAEREEVVRFWRLFNEATSLRMKGDYAGAARTYEEALTVNPVHEDCLYYLGQCREEVAQYREAIVAFEALVKTNPVSARGHLALGALVSSPDASEVANLTRAETHFRRAHEINGEETGTMVRLGEILILRGDFAQARHWLDSAAGTNPKSADAAFLSGYLRWEDGDLTGAAALYARAVKAVKTEAPVQGVLGEGDRKAAPAPGSLEPARIAAPPLKAPMGKTLFGALAPQPGQILPDPAAADLGKIFTPVRQRARELGRRFSV